MNRLVPIGALLASACGSATDDRPPTLEYITDTILAPSCASAQCHSSFKQQVGDVFDTLAATRRTLVVNRLVIPEDAVDPAHANLIRAVTVGLPSILSPGSGNIRMPYDSPMPDADVDLMKAWIAAGIPGAQCVPNDQGRGCQITSVTVGGMATTQYAVVECPDGNVGALVQLCSATQVCDPGQGNGQCKP